MPKTARIKHPIKHPYVTSAHSIAGGSPTIAGTRVRVVDVAIEYDRLGMTPDEIVDAHPHLTLEAVHDALSSYYENRDAFDREIGRRKENIKDLLDKHPSKLKQALG